MNTDHKVSNAKEMMVGNYFKDAKTGVIVEIDARSIFDAWGNSEKYESVPITNQAIKRLNGRPLDKGVSFLFGDVCIMPKDDLWVVGFKDLLGITRWTKTEIQYIHQLQQLCLDINQEPLQFVK